MPHAAALPHYPDVPPEGYQLASNRQAIDASDLVFRQGTARCDAGWVRPRPGQNIIGATVHDHWSDLLAVAVKRPSLPAAPTSAR